jgi:hypothetical protein
MAHRVISRQRSTSVTFAAKRTSLNQSPDRTPTTFGKIKLTRPATAKDGISAIIIIL